MDIKYIYIHGAQRNALLLTVIDAFSRKVLTHMSRFNIKKGDIAILLSLLLMDYQIKEVTIRNDNGSQFIANVVRQFPKYKEVTRNLHKLKRLKRMHISKPYKGVFNVKW